MTRVLFEIHHGARNDKGMPAIRIRGWVVISGCGRKIIERYIQRFSDEWTISIEKRRITEDLLGYVPEMEIA